MNSVNSRRHVLAALLVVVLLSASFAAVVQSQDTGVSSQGIVCDSTLLLLVYLAQRDYGFAPASDLSTFELGQFRERFDALPAGEEAAAESDEAAETAGDDSSDTATFQLLPGDVAGEDAACTQLRAEVYDFLVTQGNIDQGAGTSGG